MAKQADLPLFPSEKQIGQAVLGDRASEWPSLAKYLEEKHGLRKPHPLFGRRYWPHVIAAIEAYLQGARGAYTMTAEPEDGEPDYSGEAQRAYNRRGHGNAAQRART